MWHSCTYTCTHAHSDICTYKICIEKQEKLYYFVHLSKYPCLGKIGIITDISPEFINLPNVCLTPGLRRCPEGSGDGAASSREDRGVEGRRAQGGARGADVTRQARAAAGAGRARRRRSA